MISGTGGRGRAASLRNRAPLVSPVAIAPGLRSGRWTGQEVGVSGSELWKCYRRSYPSGAGFWTESSGNSPIRSGDADRWRRDTSSWSWWRFFVVITSAIRSNHLCQRREGDLLQEVDELLRRFARASVVVRAAALRCRASVPHAGTVSKETDTRSSSRVFAVSPVPEGGRTTLC